MNEHNRAATWVAQADNDAAHARHSAQGGFYEQACYSVQQAVEKALKSLLLTAGQDIGRTHSILGLRRTLENAGVSIPTSILSQMWNRGLSPILRPYSPHGDSRLLTKSFSVAAMLSCENCPSPSW